VTIARIYNSFYHPFVSLTRLKAPTSEETQRYQLIFEFLCVLRVSVVKYFI
jgi:hypothetical protein